MNSQVGLATITNRAGHRKVPSPMSFVKGTSGTGATFAKQAGNCFPSLFPHTFPLSIHPSRPFTSTALDAQTSGEVAQAGIPRPHDVTFGNSRIQEMRIDQPDAATVKVPLVDEGEEFFMRRRSGPRQSGEEFEDLMPSGKRSAGEFTDHERVAHHVAGFQPDRQLAVGPPRRSVVATCVAGSTAASWALDTARTDAG